MKIRLRDKSKNKGEYYILALTIAIAIFGIIMQYSASMYSALRDMGDKFYYVKKQSIALVFGILGMVLSSHVNRDFLKKYRYVLLASSYLLLALVFVPGIGVEKYGAKRWINVGIGTIQPSEIAKVALVIYIASEMSIHSANTFLNMAKSLVAMAIMCVLIMLEPNMSITMCIGIVTMLMLFVGGAKLRHFLVIALPIVVLIPLLIILEPYRLKRLMAFLDPWASPKGEGYQLIQSFYALSSGGMFGVGLFNSRQKYLFLPFSESDFIFSIIGEEMGLFGSLIVMAMFMAVIVYGIRTSMNANNRFDTYLSAGITILLAVQTILNIAVVSGSIPPTGLPLPLISHGGSSLVVYMSGIGLIRGVALSNHTKKLDKAYNVLDV